MLYLDLVENTATEDLLKLKDSILEHVTYKDTASIVAATKAVEKHKQLVQNENGSMPLATRIKKGMGVKRGLIIVDPAHYLTRMCRTYARDKFNQAGKYKVGGKTINIDDPEMFELEGFLFGKANSTLDRFTEALLQSGCDIICTQDPEHKPLTKIDGIFDVILELRFANEEDVGRVWHAMPTKVRGGNPKDFFEMKVPRKKSPMIVLED